MKKWEQKNLKKTIIVWAITKGEKEQIWELEINFIKNNINNQINDKILFVEYKKKEKIILEYIIVWNINIINILIIYFFRNINN